MLSGSLIRRVALRACVVLATFGGVGAVSATETQAAPAPAVVPSDDLFQDQTALQPGATIGAPEAWKVSRGAGVIVAVRRVQPRPAGRTLDQPG
jgi:hypothetical protein